MKSRKADVRIEDFFPEPRREEMPRPTRSEVILWIVFVVVAVVAAWLMALYNSADQMEPLVPPKEIALYASTPPRKKPQVYEEKPTYRGDSAATARKKRKRPAKRRAKVRGGQALRPKPFDPNVVTVEELVAMGLYRWQAEGFVRHRENRLRKGYIFATKEDFCANREIPDELDQELTPYLRVNSPLHEFDPNTVTADELMSFGVGVSQKRAEGFLKYRRKLFDQGYRFRSVEDFARVRCLGERAHEVLDVLVRVGETD